MTIREPEHKNKLVRPVSDYMDNILGVAYPVLDHGFIRVIDYMGNDESIVQAARVSYGTGTKHGQSDEALIRYLMRHWHTTPFEMVSIKLHVKLPVFTARQWIRHRMAHVNEYSARYSIMNNEFYIPETEHLAKQSTTNNQGRGEVLDSEQASIVQASLRAISYDLYYEYEHLIDPDRLNLARETARMVLPTNIYTQWYWKTDLHNLFRFLRLRADSHAQYEIQVYAKLICELISGWIPHAYKAFEDYQMNSTNFSAHEVNMIRDMIEVRDNLNQGNLSNRELNEFKNKLGL